MPQISMLPDQPTMGTLLIQVEQWPNTAFPDETVVTVKIAMPPKPVRWVNVLTLRGVQTDFLQTLLNEVCSSWQYGERPKQVGQAMNDVKRAARIHAKAHEF